MSQLEPDELARLLTQAVEPVRAAPDGYQRIRVGIERRRRIRLPLYTVVVAAAAAVFALAVLALRPGQSDQVVEPAGPLNGSVSGSGSDGVLSPTDGPRLGSGGGPVGASPGLPSVSVPPRTSPSPGTTPSGAATANPTASPTGPTAGSPTMPPPVRVPARDGDIDGDGVVDQVDMTGTVLDVRLSRGTMVPVPMPSLVTPLRHAIVDIDGDGFGEVVVRTGAENGVERYLLLRLMAPDTISIVTGSDVGLVAGIDTANGNAAGFRCGPGSLVSYSGTSTGAGGYTVLTQPWRLAGTQLVPQPGATSMYSTDTSLFRADCGGL